MDLFKLWHRGGTRDSVLCHMWQSNELVHAAGARPKFSVDVRGMPSAFAGRRALLLQMRDRCTLRCALTDQIGFRSMVRVLGSLYEESHGRNCPGRQTRDGPLEC
jgi:hypothetical protein